MKTKSILAVALAAMVTLASCSKDGNDTNPKAGETTRVVLNVEQAMGTRGTGSSINAHTVAFTDGYVVFADGSGVVTDVFTIVTTAPDAGNREINIVEGDISFDEVSRESRTVYILGNVPGITAISDGTVMSTLLAGTVTAKSQTDDVEESSVAGVTLYGKSGAIDHTQDPSTAEITVAPISSRVEIHQFTGSGAVGDYKIEGIFMNNFYNSITYNGELNPTNGNDLLYLSQDDKDQFKAGGATQYALADAGYFYDEAGIPATTSLVCKPTSGVWAYNIPAPTGGEFPHIVIRVSGVTGVTDLADTDTRWMTVTKFIYADGSRVGEDVGAFEAGKIYKITDFEFSEENLDVDPEMKTVTAKVTVTLADWEPVSVKPW